MKRAILVIFVFLTGLSLFAQSGVIRELNGTVEIKRAGAASFTAANIGDRLERDTIISTGFRSTALIEIGSTTIAVRPLTRMSVTDMQAGGGQETINVNIQAGRLRVDSNPPAGVRTVMNVTTPMATASVRGTSFDVDYRNLVVHHGNVSFSGRTGAPATNVAMGNSSSIRADDSVSDSAQLAAAELLPQPAIGSLCAGVTGSTRVRILGGGGPGNINPAY